MYITQNFVWNFGQKILHFFCVTVTHFSLCVALENFCVLNAPILFHIHLLLCNINPQLHLLHITIIHKKQTCPMKIKLHNLHNIYYVQQSAECSVHYQFHECCTHYSVPVAADRHNSWVHVLVHVLPLSQLLHVYNLHAQQLLLKMLYNLLKLLYLIKGMLV